VNAALRVEWLKLRRSVVTRTATALMVVLIPAMALGFYQVAVSGGTGAIALKAEAFLVGEGWEAFFGLVDQIVAVAVFLGAGIVTSWVFGREHVDGTFESLFALSVSRSRVAGAKFLVLGAWAVVLTIGIAVVTTVLGLVAGVDPGSATSGGLLRLASITLLTCALAMPAGYVASIGRGYLAGIGALILVVAVAQVAVLFGTGAWLPFAVPGLMAVAGSDGAPDVGAIHLGLVPIVTAIGVWLTVRWWRRAEVV
jgi:ABC-2 type transport system permease protein